RNVTLSDQEKADLRQKTKQQGYDLGRGQQYLNFQYEGGKDGKILETMREAAHQGIVHVVAAGNFTGETPHIGAALPYYEPQLEQFWISAVAASVFNPQYAAQPLLELYSSRCTVAKYFCLATELGQAPQVVVNQNGTITTGYKKFTGTSGGSAQLTGAMGVVLSRYPYLTAWQARDILLTTARGRVGGKVSEQYGWGLPDLKAAMEGPGELLRDNLVSIPAGWEDSWSNDISQAALQQRKAEDALELQEWDEKEQRAKQYRANGQTEIADSAEQELVLLRNRIDYLRARQKDPHGYEAGLTKAGDGRLILSGNNSYTGGTALLEGTLGVGSATALGTGTLDIHDGATLLSTANDLTLANAITVKGRGVVDTQANTFTLSGDITD
ncbi:S8 family serine peptidase, partial [Ralstonia pseudosolanacearum]|uniref:S8 family serine peptidase n=1 Tax=Ralstonia pseudosolanacearum TaxID=1310165 RepID=UPI003D2D914D